MVQGEAEGEARVREGGGGRSRAALSRLKKAMHMGMPGSRRAIRWLVFAARFLKAPHHSAYVYGRLGLFYLQQAPHHSSYVHGRLERPSRFIPQQAKATDNAPPRSTPAGPSPRPSVESACVSY